MIIKVHKIEHHNTKLKSNNTLEPGNYVNESVEHVEKKYVFIPYIKNVSEEVAFALNKNNYIISYRCLNNLAGLSIFKKIKTL